MESRQDITLDITKHATISVACQSWLGRSHLAHARTAEMASLGGSGNARRVLIYRHLRVRAYLSAA
jgi:hypothetical protein